MQTKPFRGNIGTREHELYKRAIGGYTPKGHHSSLLFGGISDLSSLLIALVAPARSVGGRALGASIGETGP